MGISRRSSVVVLALCVAGLVATAGLHHSAQAGRAGRGSRTARRRGAPRRPLRRRTVACARERRERDCSVTADEIDDILAGDSEGDVRHLAGFTGSLWTERRGRRPAGRARGHRGGVGRSGGRGAGPRPQRDRRTTVGAVEVTATLRDDRGEEVTVLTGPALVGTVRSGEPVPFVLSGPAPAVAVDRIDWATTIVDAPAVSRDLEWQPYWEQPAGLRDPLENHLYTEVGLGSASRCDLRFGAQSGLDRGPAMSPSSSPGSMTSGKLAALGQSAALDPAGHAGVGARRRISGRCARREPRRAARGRGAHVGQRLMSRLLRMLVLAVAVMLLLPQVPVLGSSIGAAAGRGRPRLRGHAPRRRPLLGRPGEALRAVDERTGGADAGAHLPRDRSARLQLAGTDDDVTVGQSAGTALLQDQRGLQAGLLAPGIGPWQFDSAGLGAYDGANGRIDTFVSAAHAADTMASRWCASSRQHVEPAGATSGRRGTAADPRPATRSSLRSTTARGWSGSTSRPA